MRKATSLTALISFLILVLSSVVLYITPHGRIAYWADWRFLGLTKTEWSNQHIIIGILFLLAIFFHTYYNWKAIVGYLKNKAKQIRIFTREFNIALFLVVICTIGTYVEVEPFNSVLSFSESIKNAATLKYGEPPYGHAELSTLKTFTSKIGIDLADSMKRLQDAGIEAEDEKQTLLNIAHLNNTTPHQIYALMKPKKDAGAVKAMPEEPETGFGNHLLDDICRTYGLDVAVILTELAGKNITATADATIRQIAAKNGVEPVDVFTAIRETAVKK